jgi:hypothetical protein
VAKKTREMVSLHQELAGVERLPVEEVKLVDEPVEGSKKRPSYKKRNMEKYAPLIFEECYVKHKGMTQVANTFELEGNAQFNQKVIPNKAGANYKGTHLFVMCHGLSGSSFDMRMFKNIISIALPDAQYLCA